MSLFLSFSHNGIFSVTMFDGFGLWFEFYLDMSRVQEISSIYCFVSVSVEGKRIGKETILKMFTRGSCGAGSFLMS